MIASNLAVGTAEAVLLALVWTQAFQRWNLYVLACALSLALAFQRTAYMSAIPQIVNKRYLGHANGIVQAGSGFAQLIAPLFGVGLLALVGLDGILAADVGSYLVAVGAVLFVRFPPLMELRRTESVITELLAGFRFCLGNRHFRAMLIFFAAENLLLSPFFILLSPLVLSFSHLTVVAAVTAVAGVGGITAGLTMAIWGGPRYRRMAGVCIADLMLALFAGLTGIRPSDGSCRIRRDCAIRHEAAEFGRGDERAARRAYPPGRGDRAREGYRSGLRSLRSCSGVPGARRRKNPNHSPV